MCSIIRQCYDEFTATAGRPQCFVVYGSTELDTQLCFCGQESEFGQYGSAPRVHVQIYSTGQPFLCLYHRSSITLAEGNNSRNPFRSGSDLSPSPKSAPTLEIIRRWVCECSVSHESCALPQQDFVPTRLIQLTEGDEHSARIYLPTHPVQFSALTYCWGLSPQSKTTKANISARCSHLNISDLPKTLQDAITISRELGLEYVWIDSICILQGDQDDWAREASKMSKIYSNAYVVLSATGANDCAEGFLHPRKEPLTIRLQPKGIGRQSIKVQAQLNNSYFCYPDVYSVLQTHWSLFRRGWCMQERFLARRVIHFLPDEVFFECRTGVSCEHNENLHPRTLTTSVACREFRKIEAPENPDASSEWYFAVSWASIVHEYSSLALTHSEDALPALSGLAQCMHHIKPGKYIAGLWEKGIPYFLAWYRSQNTPAFDAVSRPSFSWISCPGQVIFKYCGKHGTTLCHLASSNVELATSDSFGRVQRAVICLRARFVTASDIVSLTCLEFEENEAPDWYIDAGVDHLWNNQLSSSSESITHTVNQPGVVCLALFRKFHKVTALLLQPTAADPNQYVRIGLVDRVHWSWFEENSSEGTFTIV
jgi:hypothetical protein